MLYIVLVFGKLTLQITAGVIILSYHVDTQYNFDFVSFCLYTTENSKLNFWNKQKYLQVPDDVLYESVYLQMFVRRNFVENSFVLSLLYNI